MAAIAHRGQCDRVEPAHPDGATRPEYSGSWRVSSEVLNLATLRDALGEPTGGHDRGDLVSPGRSEAGRPHSMWRLESGLSRSDPLEAHVQALVQAAEARHEALARIRPDITTDFFCGVFRNERWAPTESGDTLVLGCGFTLEASLLARLVALDMPLTCDVY